MINRPTKIQAIISLVPGAEVSVINETEIIWHNPEVAPVTQEQIEAELVRLNSVYDAAEYQRNRAPEYPSLGDQLDALFHAGVFPADMAAQIQAVKDKYPKG
jgi:hypothetical protein